MFIDSMQKQNHNNVSVEKWSKQKTNVNCWTGKDLGNDVTGVMGECDT